MELAVDQVVGGDDAAQPLDPSRAGQPVDAGLCHEHRHGALADGHAHSERELGMDAAVAVGAARGHVDLADQPGQPRASQLRLRGRCAFGEVVVLPRHAEHPAGTVDRNPGVSETLDHRE